MVLPSDRPTSIQLTTLEPVDLFTDSRTKTPTSPSEWFEKKFPREAKMFGCAFVEQKECAIEVMTKITPIAINHEFLAAILGGGELGPKVIYFPPDLQFYFQDSDSVFKATTEQKLGTLFRGYLMRCAEEMPASVDRVKLVVDFRSDAEVKTVIKRAKSILAADSSFFSVESRNSRLKGPELEERMARQFVQHALEREPNTILTVTDAYWVYADFLKRRDLIPPKRELFKGLVAPIVKEEFNLAAC